MRIFKGCLGVIVLTVGVLTALPVFAFIADGGPLYSTIFWLVVVVVLAWLFVRRRTGSLSESSMLAQKSREGLL